MDLNQQRDPLLPRPDDYATTEEYLVEFHRRVSEALVGMARRVDSHIPYSTDGTKVLVPDATAQNGIAWGTASGGGSALTTKDEGTTLTTATDEYNFVGSGVTATISSGNHVLVTIPGASGGFLKGDEFTASGTWTAPTGVTGAWLTMIGGGGGGSAAIVAATGGGAGGTGESCQFLPIKVTAGNNYTITIGAGGAALAAGLTSTTAGNNGGDTDFASTFYARGGKGGVASTVGGAGGGVGGGAGGAVAGGVGALGTAETTNYFGGSGGSSGGNSGATNGGAGKGSGGLLTGGTGGTAGSSQAGGGGGPATIWGVGGNGGNGGSAGTDAPATSYGAGGGGAGGHVTTTVASGKGCDGYVLVQYVGT